MSSIVVHGRAFFGQVSPESVTWEGAFSLIHPKNRVSIRVAERIGETLLDRIDHLGHEMLCYGIDRETYLTQGASVGGLAQASS